MTSTRRWTVVIAALMLVGCAGRPWWKGKPARHRTYTVSLVESEPPFETRLWGGSEVTTCATWESTYSWVDRDGNERPSRPEHLEIETRCATTADGSPASDANPPVEIDVDVNGRGSIAVEGRGGSDGGDALDSITISDGSDAEVTFIDARGKRKTIRGATKIDLHSNVVIIRAGPETGWMIPKESFVELRWTGKPDSR